MVLAGSSVLIAAAILVMAVLRIMQARDRKNEALVNMANVVIEEGISWSEHINKYVKMEAAHQLGKQLKKSPVETLKDPVEIHRITVEGLKPVRQIAHDTAKKYVLDAIESFPVASIKADLKKMVNPSNIDNLIDMRIAGAKSGMGAPIIGTICRYHLNK